MTYSNNPKQSSYSKPTTVAIDRDRLTKCFEAGDAGKNDLMNLAKEYADVSKAVKANQLRNLLDIVIWVKSSHSGSLSDSLKPISKGRLAVFRPRLAYMAARESKLRDLREGLNALLERIEIFKTGAELDRLYEFVSAVVAYHKYNSVEDGKQ